MKKKLTFTVLSLILAVSFVTTLLVKSSYAYWAVYNVDSIEDDRLDLGLGDWKRNEIQFPIFTPGTVYPRGSFVKFGQSCYYRTGGDSTLSPIEDIWNWMNVPNYDEVIGTAIWDPNVSYPAAIGNHDGAIVVYDGEFYQRSSANLTSANGNWQPPYFAPPLDPGQGSWSHITSWDQSRQPMQWRPGEHTSIKIFYMNNGVGGASVYYALVTQRANLWTGGAPNPNADTQHYRIIPEWSNGDTYHSIMQYADNNGNVGGETFWPGANQKYHTRLPDGNGGWLFYEFRGPRGQAQQLVAGPTTRPGVDPRWVLMDFACTERIIVLESGTTKTVWMRNNHAPTTVSPLDPGQTVWTKRETASTNHRYVYVIVGQDIVLYENQSGQATTTVPGAAGSVWREIARISG